MRSCRGTRGSGRLRGRDLAFSGVRVFRSFQWTGPFERCCCQRSVHPSMHISCNEIPCKRLLCFFRKILISKMSSAFLIMRRLRENRVRLSSSNSRQVAQSFTRELSFCGHLYNIRAHGALRKRGWKNIVFVFAVTICDTNVFGSKRVFPQQLFVPRFGVSITSPASFRSILCSRDSCVRLTADPVDGWKGRKFHCQWTNSIGDLCRSS